MRHLFFLFCLLTSLSAFPQEPLDSARWGAEQEDSISSLSVRPLGTKETRKLIGRIGEQIVRNQQQDRDSMLYRVEANFQQGSFAPFSASCTVKAESGIGLKVRDVKGRAVDDFVYTGPYAINERDSMLIKSNLVQLSTLSPVHAHWVDLVFPSDESVMSPLTDYKKARRWYDVTAYSISDASGRRMFRLHIKRNKKQRIVNYGGIEHNHRDAIVGVAYVDARTLHLIQFKGEALVPSMFWDARFRYKVDYEDCGSYCCVKHIIISGTRSDMVIKASVRKVNRQ